MTGTPVHIDAAVRCGIGVDLPDGTALGLLLPPGDVAELIHNARVSAVPNARSWFVGLINRRGNLVPVFDLLHYFGLAPRATHRNALVVGNGSAAFALPVSLEPQILQSDVIAGDGTAAAAPAAIADFVAAARVHRGRCWCDFRFDLWLAQLAAGAIRPNPTHPTRLAEKTA
ncbi:MAG TPA: chemotaxis protein CheW [Tahibacter sp.]|nr:chemotaxis protein CheW [Tahibacter sp.]